MSFYNPYKKGPDFAQGINDMVSKLMQMVLMKQVFGRDPAQGMPTQTQAEQPTNTPMPQARGQGQMGNPMQGIVGQAPGQMQQQPPMGGQQGGGTMPMGQNKPLQISPELLQALMMMLQKPGGGGMGQMGQRGY